MATKYEPLRVWLTHAEGDRVRTTFREIESILGFRLPDSARALPQWWANTRGSHVQAAAWMDAGWRACQVDVSGEQVSFERERSRVRVREAAGRAAEGVADEGAAFRRDDAIVIDSAALRSGALRMLEDYAEATGCDLSTAVAHILNDMALERRRRLVDWFRTNAPRVPGDSTDLIREERDAR